LLKGVPAKDVNEIVKVFPDRWRYETINGIGYVQDQSNPTSAPIPLVAAPTTHESPLGRATSTPAVPGLPGTGTETPLSGATYKMGYGEQVRRGGRVVEERGGDAWAQAPEPLKLGLTELKVSPEAWQLMNENPVFATMRDEYLQKANEIGLRQGKLNAEQAAQLGVGNATTDYLKGNPLSATKMLEGVAGQAGAVTGAQDRARIQAEYENADKLGLISRVKEEAVLPARTKLAEDTERARKTVDRELAEGDTYTPKGGRIDYNKNTFSRQPMITNAEANTAEYRANTVALTQQQATQVDRANKALQSLESLERMTEQMNSNLGKGAVAEVKKWLGTGPAKAYETQVIDTITELVPAMTSSVRTLGSQFERMMKAAPNIKDQVDITRAWIATTKAIMEGARMSAAGMDPSTFPEIPTYFETNAKYNTVTTPRGNRRMRD
jgi:hypothetical protein